jgi:diguanylate cyclase (GGDEF)-like protein
VTSREPAPPLLPLLGLLPWVFLVSALGIAAALPGPADGPAIQLTVMVGHALFFTAALARLLITAVRHRTQRAALLALAAGLGLWAAGSAVANSGGVVDAHDFPAPGEVLFLASYLGLVTFLLRDLPGRSRRSAERWLDTAVVCGGVACLAGLLVLTPIGTSFGLHGVPLLLALLYPLVDTALLLIVLSQVLLRQRAVSARTGAMGLGLLAWALADYWFARSLSSGDRHVAVLGQDALFGTGFALLVAAACAPRRDPAPQHARQQRTRTLVAAAAVALAALVARPTTGLGWYVAVPAIVTLLAAGGRLTLALRQAQGAAEALRLSRTDDLTGLPNRRAILADLDRELSGDGPLALMLLDLDGFKDINDSLGHNAGDVLLRTVAARLPDVVGPDATVGRLGGDEFAVLVSGDDAHDLLQRAQRVREALFLPVRVESMDLAIRASIGVAVRTGLDLEAADLLRRADAAMYEAKLTRQGALLYDASHDGFTRQRLALTAELRRGIAEDQLVVWYQPQVDVRTRQVRAVEALVRWQHPVHGVLPPAAFLPDARRAGLMLALSEAVMRLVVADARRWLDAGLDFRVGFNCAAPELLGGSLLPRLFDAIAAADLPPDTLLVEVTEDSFIADPERARDVLLELRRHHVQTAIDDYGTGFSSLAYLRDLPVQELKMDRSFVSTIRSDPRSRVIVESTCQMAHAMGLRLVAEGVEDAATGDELAAMGVDILQGYDVARPMPADQVERWVRRRAARMEERPTV